MLCELSYFFIKFFANAFDNLGDKQNDFIYLLLALCIILPMSLINNIAIFVKFAALGNIFVGITLLVIIGYDFKLIITDD